MSTHAPRFSAAGPTDLPDVVVNPRTHNQPGNVDGRAGSTTIKQDSNPSCVDSGLPSARPTSSATSQVGASSTAPKRRVPSSSSSSQMTVFKKEYDHMLALTAKLEDKAIKADAKLREANIDREKLKAESESAKRDFRHKEAALRSQLEKTESGAQDASSRKRDQEMARRVDELRQLHRDEKSKWTTKLTALETEIKVLRAAGKTDGQRDRKLTQARVEWDEEKLRLMAELREEKQTSKRATNEKDGLLLRVDKAEGEVDRLEARLEEKEVEIDENNDEIETLQDLLADAGALYGHLASNSVDKALHDRSRLRILELEAALSTANARLLPLRISRQHQKDIASRVDTLERMLSESEWTVAQLSVSLRMFNQTSSSPPSSPPSMDTLDGTTLRQTIDCHTVISSIIDIYASHLLLRLSTHQEAHLSLSSESFDRLLSHASLDDRLRESLAAVADAQKQLVQADRDVNRQTVELTSCQAELGSLRQSERDARTALAGLQTAVEGATVERAVIERGLKERVRVTEETLERERDNLRRLASTLGQSKVAQEALREDLEKAQQALVDAQEYEEAYFFQLKENAILSELNGLAEDEARELGSLNAEMVGGQHTLNQRIGYLNKVRSELLDYKQHTVALNVDIQALERENRSLKDELHSFKSLNLGSKPPTRLSRVSRQLPHPPPPPPPPPPLLTGSHTQSHTQSVSRSSVGGRVLADSRSGGNARESRAAVGRVSVKSGEGRGDGGGKEVEGADDWTMRGALTMEDLM